ncbi:PIN domain-containing protein [Sphingomonas sp. SUN039]|uniref:type II toxin-antitoxin system VapC family toxin n=1 Tax=Sphingomonas sp. SUN039 TaxID=2937787 RepID=UPI00216477B9|nr:PIN domain-containing protein [Sphingomonas sp. SUN039]UVO55617.1 PIN domain-containing protein [Sphingomonas sp. SUN039]
MRRASNAEGVPAPLVLLDTNVIVAALAEAHEHHRPSLALFAAEPPLNMAVAAHCYAEAFTTLTRRGLSVPFQWPPGEAWAALESVASVTRLVGLSPAQSFEAVRDFSASGQIGARIYDHMIGRAASACGAKILVTWNIGHFPRLGDGLEARTPIEVLAA